MLNLLYHGAVDPLLAITLVAYYRAVDSNLNTVISGLTLGYREVDAKAKALFGEVSLPSLAELKAKLPESLR